MHAQPLWRTLQRKNFTDWKRLASFLELDHPTHPLVLTQTHFGLNLPMRLAQKMAKGDWDDPLLRQFLPTVKELERDPLFSQDPVHDTQSCKTPKLLHKYHGRALIVCTSVCAMHCRFCFRQHFDYEKQDKSFSAELEAIANDPSLSEILLSGGDPLSLGDDVLGQLIQKLSQISHVKRLRFHTRFPIGIPERIDESFLAILQASPLQKIFIIHCNHAKELDSDILAALKKVQQLGAMVLCQSVLLKGVNDSLAALRELYETLINAGILPYQLHQLDRVQGAQHFEVPVEEGRALVDALRAVLPGYAIPKYVAEIPDRPSKTPLI